LWGGRREAAGEGCFPQVKKDSQEMKEILIIKFGALGDLTYALPAAQALKSAFPCNITWVVAETYKPFLKNHRHIDTLITIDDKKIYAKNKLTRAWELLKLILKLHKRYDQVIIAHRDPIYHHVFKFFSRGQTFQLIRDTNKASPQLIYIPPMEIHESLAIKKLIQTTINFITSNAKEINWQWDYTHIPKAQIALPNKFAVLHLGGGMNAKTEFKLKCWPHWEKLILRLLNETELNLVFIGSPAEEANYKIIEATIRTNYAEKLSRCHNLMKNLSIAEMTDVIRRGDLFVGVDSGPLHIADSMNKKVCGLYGPTSTISWGLLSDKATVFQNKIACSPCYKDNAYFPPCHNQHRCMEELEVNPVFIKLTETI
jgi:ADP-heptose:LPS heptosyltransferase